MAFPRHRIIGVVVPVRTAVLAASLLLASCASENNPLKDMATAAGLATKPSDPAQFVKEKRAEQVDYMPIGQPQPKRPTEPRAASEVKSLEDSLEKVRAANESAGASVKAAGQAAASNAKPPSQ